MPADKLGLMAEGYLNICKEKVESFRFLLIFIHLILRSDMACTAQYIVSQAFCLKSVERMYSLFSEQFY